MRREYPRTPIPGVGALIIKNNSVLLVKRQHEPSKGLWSTPGGVVEVGETVKEAVVRETKEETGLDVKVDRFLEVCDVIVKDDNESVKYHYLLVNFLVKVLGGELNAASDASKIRWFTLDKLDSKIVTKTVRRLIDMVMSSND
ncbi:MAG: NUDIX hydrolase [Candidatus Hodarchaeota archaeon]